MKDYKSNMESRPWHAYASQITRVVILDGVTSIGGKAFKSFPYLTEIIFPASLTKILDYAITDCPELNSMIFLSSDMGSMTIRNNSFDRNNNYTIYVPNHNSEYIPTNLYASNTVEYYASCVNGGTTFLYFSSNATDPTLRQMVWVIRTGETGVMENKYSGWTSYYFDPGQVTGVKMWPDVTTIGSCAFANFSSLRYIAISDNLTSIGDYAFENCTSLPSVTIPNNVTSIHQYVFCGCTSLSSVSIPNRVTSIGSSAFRGCTSLTSITIPDNVTSIGDYAFQHCTRLSSITIPNNVTSIDQYVFCGCTSLYSVSIPNIVTSIGSSAFQDCTSLTSITIPNNVTSIGESAFRYCTRLPSITIPNRVRSIGDWAFAYCSRLRDLYFEGSKEQWNSVRKGMYWNNNVSSDYREHWRCSVTFNTNGYGTAPDTQTNLWSNKDKVTRPADLASSDSHLFAGWYLNSENITLWDFDNDIVPGDITLNALWQGNDLADGVAYRLTEDYSVATATYTKTLGSDRVGKHQAWLVPFDYTITSADTDKFSFYKINMIANSPTPSQEASDEMWVFLKPVDAGSTLHANMPYVYKPKEAVTDYAFTTANTTLKAKNTGVLLNLETAEDRYTVYGIYENTSPSASDPFYYINYLGGISIGNSNSVTVGPYRWIIRKTSKFGGTTSYVPEMRFFDGEDSADGIGTIDNGQLTTDNWFDLDGRRLAGKPTQKGIYIHNGRKEAIR